MGKIILKENQWENNGTNHNDDIIRVKITAFLSAFHTENLWKHTDYIERKKKKIINHHHDKENKRRAAGIFFL